MMVWLMMMMKKKKKEKKRKNNGYDIDNDISFIIIYY